MFGDGDEHGFASARDGESRAECCRRAACRLDFKRSSFRIPRDLEPCLTVEPVDTAAPFVESSTAEPSLSATVRRSPIPVA
jgi:hypothetical protein